MGHGGLGLIYLERALQEPGCPICRCCAQHEERYLQWLVWENVNDAGTRARLGQSLGLCGAHARQMLQIERSMLGMSLGNSIIYDSLIQLALGRIRRARADLPAQPGRRTLWQGLRRVLVGLWPAGRRNPADWLRPHKGCRVCELCEEKARHYARVLVDLVADDSGQALYAPSDGVCLPHLRVVLELGSHDPGVTYLLDAAAERLCQLQADLESLGWKHGIRGQQEPLLDSEADSVDRAIAFLCGSNAR